MKLLILPLAIIGLIACKPAETASVSTEATPLESYLVAAKPSDAQPITELRSEATVGQEITLTGKVMGSSQPFVEGRAMVLIGDTSTLTSCDEIPGDGCTTPWDVCCDDPEVIKNSIATIQIVGEDGRPLKTGLRGLGGLKELSTITVKGKVAEGSSAENLIVNAEVLHVS